MKIKVDYRKRRLIPNWLLAERANLLWFIKPSSARSFTPSSPNTNPRMMDTTSNCSVLFEKLGATLAEAVDASYQLTYTDVAAHRKAFAATKRGLLAEIAQLKAAAAGDHCETEDIYIDIDDDASDKILTKREWDAQMEKLRLDRLKLEEDRAPLSIIGAHCAKKLQWSQGIKSHLIPTMDLKILNGERPECWKWTSVPETIYAVAELLGVDSLDISCRINTSKLIPGVEYTAYLVFMYKANDEDEVEQLFAGLPYAEAYVGAVGEEKSITKVSLASKPFPNFEENTIEEADHYAESFEYDGWRGVELGDYTPIEDAEVELEIGLKGTGGMIKGLIIQGIAIKNRFM